MEKIKITHAQMNLILMAVEHGFRQHERGNNLQGALAIILDLYEIAGTQLTAEHPLAQAALKEDMPLA